MQLLSLAVKGEKEFALHLPFIKTLNVSFYPVTHLNKTEYMITETRTTKLLCEDQCQPKKLIGKVNGVYTGRGSVVP